MSLAGLALIAAGLLAVWHEIGRPWRFLNVLRGARSSWMTREAMVAGPLFATGFAAVMLAPSPAAVGLTVAAAALALGFLYCQARIVQASKGIPAWRERAIVPAIAVTGLAEGAGLFVAASVLLPQAAPLVGPAALVLVGLLMARLITWHLYLMALRASGAPTRTFTALERLRPTYEIGGHLVPVLLLAAGWLLPAIAGPAFALAGLIAFAGGWAFKYTLITRAAYTQGFAVSHMPARGAGTAAPGVKPGWTVT
jgi:phenylacetyl-CoA:acceptor oxidoreductase subunit 2